MSTAKVFIVDDHQIIIDGLEKIIEEMEDVELGGIAHDGKEALDKIPALKPDLVLMDLDMPVKNGLDASAELLKLMPELKIIILTMHGERSIVEKMVRLGTHGYFIKNTDKEELKLGIRQVLGGKKYFHYEALTGFVSGTQLSQSKLEMEQLSVLSEREIDVLKGIAYGNTAGEIAEELFISARTVETHRKNILQKLEAKNTAELIRFAIKSGLVG